jgi:hypothetical protein
MRVVLDNKERIVTWDYRKLTCGKEIAPDTRVRDFCVGRGIAEIVQWDAATLAAGYFPGDRERRFVAFLELRALQTAYRMYSGAAPGADGDSGRFRVVEVYRDAGSVTIVVDISPPRAMPRIIPCGEREEKGTANGEPRLTSSEVKAEEV